MSCKIFFDKDNKKALEIKEKLEKRISQFNDDRLNQDFVFIIGGDGYFLSITSKLIHEEKKIIFLNAGTLGFYSDNIPVEKINFNDILNEDNFIPLDLLVVIKDNKKWYCINDFSLNSTYAIDIEVYVNDILLDEFKGNGVLVSTPMGSTARNKSLGGPIIMPGLNTFAITEIEPIQNKYYHSLKNSIIINNSDKVKITTKSFNKYSLIVDGFVYEGNQDNEEVTISHTKSKAKILIKTDTKNWIHKLNYAFK